MSSSLPSRRWPVDRASTASTVFVHSRRREAMDDPADLPVSAAVAAPGRPFGAAADLDLDFGTADRPALVSALLAGCRPAPPHN